MTIAVHSLSDEELYDMISSYRGTKYHNDLIFTQIDIDGELDVNNFTLPESSRIMYRGYLIDIVWGL